MDKKNESRKNYDNASSRKNGVNILKKRYEIIKEFILQTMADQGEISFEELTDLAVDNLAKSFDGKVLWYLVTVKPEKKLFRNPKKAKANSLECETK